MVNRINALLYQAKAWKMAAAAVAFAGYLLLAVKSGGVLWQGIWVWVCAGLYLYLPGKAAARLFGFQNPPKGQAALLYILFGCGSFAAATCVAARFGAVWLLRLIVPAAGLGWAVFCAIKKGLAAARADFLADACENANDGFILLLAAMWGLLCLLFAFAISLPNARPLAVEVTLAPSQDLLWNIGNAKSFALGFPPQDIRFSEVRFSYHYLTELIWGGLAMVTGVDAYDLIAFWSGPIVLAALLCALWSIGLRFYKGSKKRSLLFVFLLFFCNCASGIFAWGHAGLGLFGNSDFLHLFTNINAQATVLIFLSAFLLLFANAAQASFAVSWQQIAALCCSFLLCCVAKGPAAAIVMCSFVITMLLVLLFQKPDYLKAISCLVGVGAIFALVYSFLFSSGANNSMVFSFNTIYQNIIYAPLEHISDQMRLGYFGLALICVAEWFLMQPVQFLLYMRGLPADIRRLPKLAPERLLANGVVVGGMIAYFLFWHQSYSQVYFALIAFFFTSLLAADAAKKIKKPQVKAVLAVVGAWTVLSTCMMAASTVANSIGILQKQNVQSRAAFATPDDEAAMKWLVQNTPKTARFATNRIHSFPGAGNGISNLYTALSGRQAFMEGYTYAFTNMGISEQVLNEKIFANSTIFNTADADEAHRICAENGIEYLVFSAPFGGSTEQFSRLEKVFESGSVSIWKVQ